MLQQMREAQGWIIKGVLCAVVLAFVGGTIFYSWGVRRSSSAGPSHTEVATILGQPISVQAFQRTQNALYQSYSQFFRNQPAFDLRERFNFREMALEQLAREALLLRIAEENNLRVTDEELYDHIAKYPAFQADGRFDPEIYTSVLRSQVPPIPLQRFEAEQRQSLLRSKVPLLVQQSVQVTAAEAEQAYKRENEQVAMRYAILVPSLFESEVKITDEAVQQYYDTHRQTYRKSEQRQVRYVVITPQRFTSTEDFTPEAIEVYYNSHQELFQRQEQVKARHILLKVDEVASAEEVEKVHTRAESVLVELRNGGDFAAVAEHYSEDTATAAAGGELGFFSHGQMVKAFEEAAFALPVGQLSDLIRTPFGFHILLVEDKLEPGLKALVEVRQEVIAKLQAEKAHQAAQAFTDDFVVTLEDNPGRFEELARQHDLTMSTTPFVSATDTLPDLAAVPNFLTKAFALVGQAIDTVPGPEGSSYVLQVADTQPTTIPPLEAVKARVEQDVKAQEAATLAAKKADAWATQIQSGTRLEDLATPLQVQVHDTELFKRRDPIPQLGQLPTLRSKAFSLPVGKTAAVHEGKQAFVIQVTAHQEADMAAYATTKDDYRNTVLQRKQRQVLQAFQRFLSTTYQTMRQTGKIVINPQYVF